MSKVKIIEGDFAGTVANYAVVVARFNSYIVDSLESGAIDALKRHGVTEANITVIKVPGASGESSLAVQKAAESRQATLMRSLLWVAVIRGSTPSILRSWPMENVHRGLAEPCRIESG